MAEVAPYVRKGILTVEEYKKAKDEPEIVHPYLKLSKDKLIKKAQSLKISASPDVTKEVLVEAILEKEEKDKKEAEAKKKADEEAKIKEKTEAEAKAKAKAVPKAKPKAPVKKKPASKPKAKPSKKKGKR